MEEDFYQATCPVSGISTVKVTFEQDGFVFTFHDRLWDFFRPEEPVSVPLSLQQAAHLLSVLEAQDNSRFMVPAPLEFDYSRDFWNHGCFSCQLDTGGRLLLTVVTLSEESLAGLISFLSLHLNRSMLPADHRPQEAFEEPRQAPHGESLDCCRFCGPDILIKVGLKLEKEGPRYFAKCPRCGARGPLATSEAEARRLWGGDRYLLSGQLTPEPVGVYRGRFRPILSHSIGGDQYGVH